MDLERAERVGVVGGDEDHVGIRADELEDLEPVELRHPDVQKDEVGLQVVDGPDRLEPVGALGDDLHVRMPGRVLLDRRARELLVVHHDRPDSHPPRRQVQRLPLAADENRMHVSS